MNRKNWTATLTVRDLKDAALKKALHHEERLSAWTAKLEDLQEHPVMLHQGNPPSLHLSSTVQGPVIGLHPDYSRDLNQAKAKVEEHTRKMDEYMSWTDFFHQADEYGSYEVDWEDVVFFGLQTEA